MSLCSVGISNLAYCSCECHKMQYSVNPPICKCNCNSQKIGGYGSISTKTEPTFQEIQNFKISINTTVNSLSKHVDAQEKTINDMREQIERLERGLKGLQGIQESINRTLECLRFLDQVGNKPHKCPVCDGVGYKSEKIHYGFVGAICKSCEGEGIVWG